MTWSYDTALTADKDRIRLIIGDTDTNDQLLQDEEIAYFLTLKSNVFEAAALAASSIQSKFARLADTTVETVSVKYSQKAAQYAALAEDLDRKAKEDSALVSAYAGGISIADVDDVRDDDDRVKPKFRIDQFSNPPSGIDDDIEDDS